MAKIARRQEEDEAPPPIQEELPLEGLRLGDVGRGVSTLQLRIGVGATGHYCPQTKYVVEQIQKDLGFAQTGVADPRLHGRLGLPWPPLEN